VLVSASARTDRQDTRADVYPSNQKEIGWCDLHITPEAAQQSILKSLGCDGDSFSSGMEIL
jgi:hypothetical protein